MERKPDQSYVLSNLDLVDCLLRGGAEKSLWDYIDPKTLARGTLETHSNGVVLRIWLRGSEVPAVPAARAEPNCGKHHGQRFLDCIDCQALSSRSNITERTKEEAEAVVASLEKTLLGPGPEVRCADCGGLGPPNAKVWEDEGWRRIDGRILCKGCAEEYLRKPLPEGVGGFGLKLDEDKFLGRTPQCCHPCADEGVTTAAPPESKWIEAGGWRMLDGRLHCPMHAERAIRAAQRELGYQETPESLSVLLGSLLPETDQPHISVLREWFNGAHDAFTEVAAWARREHAWTHPIRGKEPPPKLPMPEVLAGYLNGPRVEPAKKRAAKKAPTGSARVAAAHEQLRQKPPVSKKRIRTRKASPADPKPPKPPKAPKPPRVIESDEHGRLADITP